MINRSKLRWCEDDNAERKEERKGLFGPPLFDEKSMTYKWRYFKKGFVWGKSQSSCYTIVVFCSRSVHFDHFDIAIRPLPIRDVPWQETGQRSDDDPDCVGPDHRCSIRLL